MSFLRKLLARPAASELITHETVYVRSRDLTRLFSARIDDDELR